MAKLKDILSEAFEGRPQIDKYKVVEGVKNFGIVGKQLYNNNNIVEIAKQLRKIQGKIVKDWMTKAKSGIIDFFDIYRGLQYGDITRAHPYETDFLHKVLTKDKIIDRFRKYFGGKKGKRERLK